MSKQLELTFFEKIDALIRVEILLYSNKLYLLNPEDCKGRSICHVIYDQLNFLIIKLLARRFWSYLLSA